MIASFLPQLVVPQVFTFDMRLFAASAAAHGTQNSNEVVSNQSQCFVNNFYVIGFLFFCLFPYLILSCVVPSRGRDCAGMEQLMEDSQQHTAFLIITLI